MQQLFVLHGEQMLSWSVKIHVRWNEICCFVKSLITLLYCMCCLQQAQHPVFYHSTVALAYKIAARAHAGQLRKSGETVLSHCAATALILAELGLSEDVVAAGLLHDVLCDTSTQASELSQQLPVPVVSLVSKVAQLNQLSQTYRDNTHSLEAEAMLDMLTGMDDVSALLIKLADRLHNMRTIGSLARCKQVSMVKVLQKWQSFSKASSPAIN